MRLGIEQQQQKLRRRQLQQRPRPDGYDNCDANGHTRTNHAMASGYKVQRRHTMGGVIATTRNDGFYTDRIGGHGHGTFT